MTNRYGNRGMRCEVRRSGTRAADGLPRDRLDAGTMHDTEGDHGQQLAAARGLASSPTDSQAACMAGEADVDTVWVHCEEMTQNAGWPDHWASARVI